VKLVDSNVWLALVLRAHQHHEVASEWFGTQAASNVALCRATQMAILRLLTTNAVLDAYDSEPLTNEQALALIDGLLTNSRVSFAPEPAGLDAHWRRFAGKDSPSPKLWMDAYLAAFAVAGNHELVSVDAAFRQFDGLSLRLLV